MANSGALVAVLAAGRSSRFGGAKLDTFCAGKPLGQWVLEAVDQAGFEGGVIITPPDIPHFARRKHWKAVPNKQAFKGLSTSVAQAASCAAAAEKDLILLLADMPLIDAGYVRDLGRLPGVTVTSYPDGSRGVPMRISQSEFWRLNKLKGDRGAAAVLSEMGEVRVLIAPPDMHLDVDTPEDHARVEELLRQRG